MPAYWYYTDTSYLEYLFRKSVYTATKGPYPKTPEADKSEPPRAWQGRKVCVCVTITDYSWFVVSTPLKNMIVKLGSSSPIFGVKIKNIWNHHLVPVAHHLKEPFFF